MTTIKIFFWDDEPRSAIFAEDLKRLWSKSGIELTPVLSDSVAVGEVVEKCRNEHPDFVVLDIYHNKARKALGTQISKALRSTDPLVPIVAITEYPGMIVEEGQDFHSMGFNDVFPKEVLVAEKFKRIVFDPVITECNRRHPDYSLIRYCMKQLDDFAKDNPRAEQLRKLSGTIVRLALTGDRDNWHSILARRIKEMIDAAGMEKLASHYEKVTEIFQKADRFYMAEGSSRKHLSHNVQVFILGLATLLSKTEVRTAMIKDLRGRIGGVPDDELPYLGMLAWACFATTHDVGYLVEKGAKIAKSLSDQINRLQRMRGTPGLKVTFSFKGGTKKKVHHALVGQQIWDRFDGSPAECEIATLVGKAIARHDCDRTKFDTVPTTQWIEFVAVLCDELQDWERFRPEAPPGNAYGENPWRVFSLNVIVIGETPTGESLLLLGFVASWNDDDLAEGGGTVGIDKVKERFDKILKRLERNLAAKTGFTIKLMIRMLSAKGTSETSTKKLRVV